MKKNILNVVAQIGNLLYRRVELGLERNLQRILEPRFATALPHPGPLPLGEGEPFAASKKNLRRDWPEVHPNFDQRRWLPPSPSGRGIEGVGERAALSKIVEAFNGAIVNLPRFAVRVCALAMMAACFSAFGSDGDEFKTHLTLKPSLLHASLDKNFAAALKYDAKLNYNLALAPRDDLALTLESRGTIATRPHANSENLFAAFLLGYAHDFYDWTASQRVPPQGERRGRALPTIQQDSFSALVEVDLKARFETDQLFNNYNFTYGPHIGFTPKHQQGWAYLMPSCDVDYQHVEVLHSERYRQLGIAEDAFWRFDASAGWLYPIGSEWFRDQRWLRPLDVQFDFHYFRSFDLPAGATAANLDEAFYYAGTIGYNLRSINPDHPSAFARYVPYIYVSVGRGRLPPVTQSQTMIYIGIVYGKGH